MHQCLPQFDPQIVVLTGGMTNAGTELLSKVRAAYTRHHWNISDADPSRIVLASCGNAAGKSVRQRLGSSRSMASFYHDPKLFGIVVC